MKRRETGALGEKVAGAFLENNGYEIIARNYRCTEGEVDIIANCGDTLVFIEVRTKRNRQYGSPEESITPVKKERLRALAERYIQEHEIVAVNWRIDVVAVEMEGSGRVKRIEIIENAVEG
jgi:putative endonuclease